MLLRFPDKKKFLHYVLLFLISAILNCRPISSETVLHDLSEAINISKQNNEELRLIILESEKNMKVSKASIEDFLPALDFSWTENDIIEHDKSDTRQKNISMTITQPVFNGGKNLMKYQMNRLSSLFSLYEAQNEVKEFEITLTELFYNYIYLVKELEIKKSALSEKKFVQNISELKKTNGLITQNEYLEANISVMEAEDEIRKKENEMKTALKKLNDNLGLEEAEEITVSSDFFENHFTEGYYSQCRKLKDKEQLLDALCLENSIDLKKQQTEIQFNKKELNYEKNVFIPTISLGCGINFSGKKYPLTEPSYTLKVIIGFENNPFVSSKLSGTYGFRKGKMNSLYNSGESSLNFAPSFFPGLLSKKVTLQRLKYEETVMKKELYETVNELIFNHDSCLDEIELQKNIISLMESNLSFLMLEFQQGKITESTYLESLNKCSEKKIEMLETMIELELIKKQLENLSGIPYGALYEITG